MEAEVKQEQYQPVVESKQKKNILGIISMAICIVMLCISVSLFTKVTQVTDDNEQIKKQLGIQAKYILFSQFEHHAEQGLVTEDLVVNKITFDGDDTPLLMTLDVTNQPATALKYNGNGAYEMEDRDVKAMCSRIVEEVKSAYDEWGGLPAWNDEAEVTVTVQNYELGTYKAGKFTLKGE